jgi:hypothetical protein
LPPRHLETAPLMAQILTLETILAALTLPIAIGLIS